MSIRAEIDITGLNTCLTNVFGICNDLSAAGVAAMTTRCHEIVQGNIGAVGYDRPKEWPALKPEYAKRVKRGFATLYLSEDLRSSDGMHLYDAIQADPQAGRVSASNSDVAYATVHQMGGGNNIPPRPYFPINDSGDVTQKTTNECRDAAIDALKARLG